MLRAASCCRAGIVAWELPKRQAERWRTAKGRSGILVLVLARVVVVVVVVLFVVVVVGVGGGKERGGCHLNLRTWHAEGRRLILGLCWAILGLCWSILRLCSPMLAHLEGYVGPSWGYVGPFWGYIGPSWGLCRLCWSILGAMLAHLEAMLAHLEAYVGPCWPIWRPKLWNPTPNREKRENPSRLKDFRGGSAAGARPRVAKAMLS